MEEILPLTPLQEGLFFHSVYDETQRIPYLVQAPLVLSGTVDAGRLRAAFEALLQRHAALRAGFVLRRSGRPVQVGPVRRRAALAGAGPDARSRRVRAGSGSPN